MEGGADASGHHEDGAQLAPPFAGQRSKVKQLKHK